MSGLTFPWPEAPAPGQATEVAKGVLWIRLPLPMTLDHVNAYALDDGDGWTLVDTGLDTPALRQIWQDILSGPMAGKPVTRVVITHHHPDHIGLAGWFMAQGATLVMPRTGYLMARMLRLDEQPLPTPEALAFWRGAGMPKEMLAERAKTRPFNFADCVAPLPLGVVDIPDGGTLRMGGRDWTIRMGQGHAPDHATFWSHDGEIVIAGDHLLPGISPNVSVYPTEPQADPLQGWLESCRAMAPHATDAQLVLGGHKLPYRGLPLRLRQLIDNHGGALKRLRAHLDTPRVASDCFAPLFKRKISEGAYGLALGESYAHLMHLLYRQEVRRWRDTAEDPWLWQAV